MRHKRRVAAPLKAPGLFQLTPSATAKFAVLLWLVLLSANCIEQAKLASNNNRGSSSNSSSDNSSPNGSHQDQRNHRDAPNSKVDVALATNPLLPKAVPLGHLNPFGGIENSRRPSAGGVGAFAWPQAEARTNAGLIVAVSLGRGSETGTTSKWPSAETKSLASVAAMSSTEAWRDMIDGLPGDKAPTGRQRRAADKPTGGLPEGAGRAAAAAASVMDQPSRYWTATDGVGAETNTLDATKTQTDDKLQGRHKSEGVASLRPADSSLIGSNADHNQKQLGKVINSSNGAGELQDQHQEKQQQQQSKQHELGKLPAMTADRSALARITRRNSKLKCRVEKDLYLGFEEYQHYTCAHCYNQVPPEYFNNKLGLVREEGRMIRLEDRESEQLIWTNETARIKQTFKVEEKFEKWQICCKQANECCLENAKYLPIGRIEDNDDDDDDNLDRPLVDDPERNECPGTWDGLSCWGPSAAGRLAWRECPRVAYLLDFEPACRGYVTKQCFQNASWFINRNGHEWSDYSACSPEGLYKARMLHASLAYVCEALIVVPALLIIGKFPNRGGNKRIRIMKSLLFYILLNSLIQALQRGFLAAGYFAEYRGGPTRVEHHSSSRQQLHQSQQQQQQQQQEQSAVPTKLALISSLNEASSSFSSIVNNDGDATRHKLVLRATSTSLPDESLAKARGLKQQQRHARSVNAWEPNPIALAIDDDIKSRESDDQVYDLEYRDRYDDDADLVGEDDDNDDMENELVARIFPTAPDRHSTVPFQRFNDDKRSPQSDKLERLTNNGNATSWPSWLKNRGIFKTTRGSENLNNNAIGIRDGYDLSKHQSMSQDGANLDTNTSLSGQHDHHDLRIQHSRHPRYTQVPDKHVPNTSVTNTESLNSTNTSNNNTDGSRDQRYQSQIARTKRKESAWKAFFCWFLQMASRLVRLMSYAWMFTGGVYLCSALHFAPAEPPAKFIKILFFLTNAFPNLIFFAYVTARTINEPSPLNIIIKAPYYWFRDDDKQVEHLYETQKVCWFEESKSQSIEDIADLPNLILVASNVVLFVITLVILCRINRPGSTRPDMSPCAYFKAAGTLLFLYGGHYFFLAYRPESESCSVDTFMFYAFICIDVVQGIAISIVFCYMTQEGKSVITKYWRNKHRFTPFRQITWLSCFGDKYKLADNGYHHTPYNNIRLNQSMRSNTSACNGHNDNVTELVNINDTQVSGCF